MHRPRWGTVQAAAARVGPGSDRVLEPDTAVCILTSLQGWPILREGLDAAVAVSDAGTLRAPGPWPGSVHAGASGAASLAGFDAVLPGPGREHRRAHLGLDEESVVVLLNTEGAGGGGQRS